MSRSIRPATARPMKGESGGMAAQAASASRSLPLAFSLTPSRYLARSEPGLRSRRVDNLRAAVAYQPCRMASSIPAMALR